MYHRKLKEIPEKYGRHSQHIIVVDFNAKIVKRLPEKEGYSGQYVVNPGNQQVDNLPESQLENRDMLVLFCMEENYMISSKFFQKSHQFLLAFRNTQSATLEPPFSSNCQILPD